MAADQTNIRNENLVYSHEEQGVQTVLPQPSVIASANGSDDEIEIDLVELFYVLWDKIWIILLSLVIGGAAAFIYTYALVTPMYAATAKMYILSSSSNSVVNLSDLQISSSLRSDYQELLTSRPILEKVINTLALEYTYDQLDSMIKVENPKDTRILNVTVTTPVPKLSADIANQLVLQGQKDLPAIMKSDEPSIFEDAIVPTQKCSPSFSRNTAIGALLLMMLTCGVIILRHVMKNTIETADDVQRLLGIQPLALIPDGDIFSDMKTKPLRRKERKERKSDEKNTNGKND